MPGSSGEAAPVEVVAPRPRTQVTALHDRAQAGWLADLAADALLAEVELAPKPGLVDPTGPGAHRDMDVETFRASVAAMRPWFPVLHETGRAGHRLGPAAFRDLLRGPGRECEHAMFAATRGVNTHKGAVFAFAMLLGCAGRLAAAQEAVTVAALTHLVRRMSAGLVADELSSSRQVRTYGERAYRSHGLTGARGEAASGYASVVRTALPAYHEVLARTGDEDLALLQALLTLMARTDDTTLVKGDSVAGLRLVQRRSGELLAAGGVLAPDGLRRVELLDVELSAAGLSPGGCADLLAVTYFLAHLG